ncbi:hypothetical protein ADL04_06840 [Streptomyces sp. NRRL B-3648]|nr:hypothetical protein ADL04_06840 [Streptomyces sp. NRRL B-3648]
MWIDWSLDGVGSAGEEVEDVAAAVRAVEISVERARRAFETDSQWRTLRRAADRMQARMLDEGRKALARGEGWGTTIEGVHVRLEPRE